MKDLNKQLSDDDPTASLSLQAQLKILIDFAEEGFYACRVTDERTLIFDWATPKFLQLTGHSLFDLNTIGGLLSLVQADERDRVENEFQQALNGIVIRSTFRIITGDQQVHFIEQRLQPTFNAEQGHVTQLIGIIRKINSPEIEKQAAVNDELANQLSSETAKRKDAEEALRVSEDRAQVILAAIPDMMFLMNRQGETLDYYPGIYGSFLPPSEEFIGKNVSAVFPEEISLQLNQAYRKAIDEQTTQELEITLPVGRRKIIIFDVRIVPVNGQRAMSIVRDVTTRHQTEQSLHRSEQRNRAFLRAIPDAITVTDPNGICLEYHRGNPSPNFLAEDDMLGKNLREVMPTEFLLAIRPATIQANVTGEPQTIVVPFTINQKQRQFETRLVLIEDGNLLSITRDVTDRVLAEQALRASEEQNRALLQAIPDMIFLVNQDGYYLKTYAHTPDDLLTPIEDHVGKHTRDVVPSVLADEFLRINQLVLSSGEMQIVEYELPFVDGKKTFEARIVPCGTDKVLSIVRNISERKRNEEALHTAEAKYRNLIEQIPAAVYIDHIVEGSLQHAIYLSPFIEKILGYPPEAFYADPTVWERLIYPADAHETLELYRKHCRYHLPMEHEYRMVTHDGRVIWVHDESTMISEPAPVGVYSQGLLTDITKRKESEAELRAAEAKYRNLIEQIPAAIYIDRIVDGKMDAANYMSPFVEKILGYSPVELMDEPQLWMHLVHPDDRQPVQKRFSEHYQARTPLNIEYRMLTRQAHEVWVRNQAVVLWNEANGAFYSQGVVHDISDRKRAEQVLRLQNARLKAQLEAAPDGILTVDNNRNWIGFNQRFLEIFNLPDQVTNIGDSMIALQYAQGVVADRDEFVRVTNLLYQDMFADTQDEVQFKDGRVFDRRSSPVVDTDTGVLGRIWVYREVTQQKRSEELLRAAEAEYRALFDNMPLGIYRSSLEGRQLRANPALAHLNGYDSEEAQLQGVNDINTEWYVAPSRREEFQKQIELNGAVHNFESEIYRHKTRERIWISEDAVAILDKRNNVLYYEGTVQDITKRKEAEQAIQRLNQELQNALRLKDEFLANMSHEFRTPLTVILTLSESIANERYGTITEQQSGVLQRVHKQGRHLLDMVNNLLDMAALASGSIALQKGRVLISDICVHSIYTVKEAAEKKKVNISYLPDANVKTVIGDERRLGQIVQSLLDNAIKFTPEGGKIGVEVHGNAAHARVDLVVWDTGIGVSDYDQQKLFQPFIQLDTTLSRRNDGAGLGLALAYHLAQLHGGTITLSNADGQGARFTVSLPWPQN